MEFLRELSFPCERVIPISLYRKPSALRDWLKYYKPGEEEMIPDYEEQIGLILARYIFEYGSDLMDQVGDVDCVCVVPSARGHGIHRLEEVYREHVGSSGPPLERLLERGPGEVGHRKMSDVGFLARESVEGRRVLLLDDVYTTGGTSQSAASALQLAGAVVRVILVVGRRLNPDFHPAVQVIWDRQAQQPYDFKTPPFWIGEW